MAKNDNLSDFMADIADVIRAKKGTSEPINAQDFSSEIASIETGDGAMEYWTSPETHNISLTIALFCPLIKGIIDGTMMIGPSSMILAASNPSDTEVKAIAFDRSTMWFMDGEYGTLGDVLSTLGWDDSDYIQITEEEFYSIN